MLEKRGWGVNMGQTVLSWNRCEILIRLMTVMIFVYAITLYLRVDLVSGVLRIKRALDCRPVFDSHPHQEPIMQPFGKSLPPLASVSLSV